LQRSINDSVSANGPLNPTRSAVSFRRSG
jgi:hypothetical protein